MVGNPTGSLHRVSEAEYRPLISEYLPASRKSDDVLFGRRRFIDSIVAQRARSAPIGAVFHSCFALRVLNKAPNKTP